jgi:hypothetical protein
MMTRVALVPLQTIWRWPEGCLWCQRSVKGRVHAAGNEYRADTGTRTGDKDSLATQSGCVEDGHG